MSDPKIRYDILANAEGEEDVRRLATELGKLDDAIDPAAAARAKELADEIGKLGRQQAAISGFREIKGSVEAARIALDEAQQAAQKAGRELAESEKPTRAQAAQFDKLKDAVKAAKGELQSQTGALDASRAELGKLGIATDGLNKSEIALRDSLKGARAEIAQIGQQGQAVEQFRTLGKATDDAAARLTAAEKALDRYKDTLTASEAPSRAQTQQLSKLSESARQAQIAYQGAAQAQAQAGSALRAAGVDTERLATSQQRLPPQLTATAAAAQRVAGGYTQAGAAAAASSKQQTGANDQVKQSLDGIAGKLNSLRNIGIAGILGSQTAQLLKGVAETADEFNNLSARIKLVTGDGPALQQALAGVQQIALSTGATLETTGTLFTRVLAAGKEIGLAQDDALKLTQAINQAVAISGGSAASSDAAITQLIQGLQSGVLRGEEFNSVMEQAPRLATALADSLGVTKGALRGMAQEGRISSQVVIEALQSQAATLDKEFSGLPATVGRALTNLGTQWTVFVGQLDKGTGSTRLIADGVNLLADNLGNIAAVAERAGSVLLAAMAIQGVGALRAIALQAAATGGSFALLKTEIDKVPKAINIAIAVTGFEIGYQIGEFLRENSALARKLGIGLTEFATGLVNDLQFVKEAAAAVFTSDTIGQAFDRFKERAETQRAIFADMYREAEQTPEVVRAAAAAAAAGLDDVGTAATTAGATMAKVGATGAAGVSSVGTAADTAASAITTLAATAGIKLPAIAKTATQQAAAMGDLAAKSETAARAIGAKLPEAISKLSGSELTKFRDTFVAALGSGVDKAQLLQTVLVETGRRAAQALGVDVAKATNTLSKEFVEAQDQLALLVKSAGAFRAAGLDAGKVVGEALRKMAEGAKNQAEFDALRSRIEALGKAGVLAKQQVVDMLESLKRKAEDAKLGVDKLAEAYKFFGLQTKVELQRIADDSRTQWERIRTDATLTLNQKQAAFKKYADAAIAANGGVADSTVRAQAQSLKLALQADATGKVIVQSMDAATTATDKTKKAFVEAGYEIDEFGRKVQVLPTIIDASRLRINDVFSEAGKAARNASIGKSADDNKGIPSGSKDLDQSKQQPGASGTSTKVQPGAAGAWDKYATVRSQSDSSALGNRAPTTVTRTTPPPDDSGDWEWIPMLNRNAAGGEWRRTAAAVQRLAAEARAKTGNLSPFGGTAGGKAAQPVAAPRAIPSAEAGEAAREAQRQQDADRLRELQARDALLRDPRSYNDATLARDTPQPVMLGRYEVVLRLPTGNTTNVDFASRTEAEEFIRQMQDAFKAAGG